MKKLFALLALCLSSTVALASSVYNSPIICLGDHDYSTLTDPRIQVDLDENGRYKFNYYPVKHADFSETEDKLIFENTEGGLIRLEVDKKTLKGLYTFDSGMMNQMEVDCLDFTGKKVVRAAVYTRKPGSYPSLQLEAEKACEGNAVSVGPVYSRRINWDDISVTQLFECLE